MMMTSDYMHSLCIQLYEDEDDQNQLYEYEDDQNQLYEYDDAQNQLYEDEDDQNWDDEVTCIQ